MRNKQYFVGEIRWIENRINWCSKMIDGYNREIRYYKNLPINDIEYKESRIKHNVNMRAKFYRMRKNWKNDLELMRIRAINTLGYDPTKED